MARLEKFLIMRKASKAGGKAIDGGRGPVTEK